MASLRQKALEALTERKPVKVDFPSNKVSDYFGDNCYNDKAMRGTLSPTVYKKVSKAIKTGSKIDEETAEAVAQGLISWATAKGVTHFTHWFQPLTGATAEKHDSFFDALSGIEKFKGSLLVQQEPDASSFPNGGIRSTFEARGYTGWDPSSPIFIVGTTLCIPTIFVSYTGETLDYKGALLKAVEAVDKATVDVCKYFDENVNSISVSLGCEQEYFAIDKDFYHARPDLVMSGRTLYGAAPARGQQLDDHYFGSIQPRILEFMKEFEIEALKLGIPVTTRHNEVAPGQFEVAPLFEEVNVASDHNLQMMDIIERVGAKHNLKILFHEKPFAGLNGSGKHNNWSLITNTGRNLLDPKLSNQQDALYFLTFFVNTLRAVAENGDLLRASIASAGNDHRLGANEAPPAIVSCFIGGQLTELLEELENTGDVKIESVAEEFMKLGIDKIPNLTLDTTDRNRTSPFAFTGNKFEYRAVGSAANSGSPMMVLNLIVAEQLRQFKNEVDGLIADGTAKESAILSVLKRYVSEAKKVCFEGDGYSDEWVAEAEKRGLSNVKDTPRALDFFVTDKAKKLFADHGVFNERELEARHEVWLENYSMKIGIEAGMMADLALNQILPAVFKYQAGLVEEAKGLKDLGIDNSAVVSTIEEISALAATVKTQVTALIAEKERVDAIESSRDAAIALCDDIKGKYFDTLRDAVDSLERIVDDAVWPLPKYREMLFVR